MNGETGRTVLDRAAVNALRMERMHLTSPAGLDDYDRLYQDLQPGQNVYWNGFGQPPTLSFRTDFDDLEYNRQRQRQRRLVKGRFAGGNLGWIVPEDLELFAGLYRKPLTDPTDRQLHMLELLRREGPATIQQIKEVSGLLVKEITPVLHRLQEAFLIYEDQYDGEWDRGWYDFAEMFPQVNVEKYTRQEALQETILRFACRMIWFDTPMLKSFYRLPEKELKVAAAALVQKGSLLPAMGGYIRPEDADCLKEGSKEQRFVYAMHRNDPLYKAVEHKLKPWIKPLTQELDYDCEPLQYLLIDGQFRGAVVGHFRNGPYDLNDVVLDDPALAGRREEILEAVRRVNFGRGPVRFMGKKL